MKKLKVLDKKDYTAVSGSSIIGPPWKYLFRSNKLNVGEEEELRQIRAMNEFRAGREHTPYLGGRNVVQRAMNTSMGRCPYPQRRYYTDC